MLKPEIVEWIITERLEEIWQARPMETSMIRDLAWWLAHMLNTFTITELESAKRIAEFTPND